MRVLPFAIFFAAVCFASCKNKPESVANRPSALAGPSVASSKLADSGTTQLISVLDSYYALKEAFVASDAKAVDAEAKKLMIAAHDFRALLMVDSVNGTALLPYLDSLEESATAILSMQDASTEYKRLHFERTSDAMYGMLTAVELHDVTIYRQYCPVAMNDEGAYWLSNSNEIRNPYFGQKMLECGEITDTLK